MIRATHLQITAFSRSVLLLYAGCILSGCAALFSNPPRVTQDERIESLSSLSRVWPVSQATKISFSDEMVPFVQASRDEDCAFAIGVAHAHLRLGQMELLKRISQGRISESAGPLGTSAIDELLRRIDFGRSVDASLALLSPSDRLWLDRYVEGVNFVKANLKELPFEYRVLALENEPWTLQDTFRIARLSSADINWGALLRLLRLRDDPTFESVWREILNDSASAAPSIETVFQIGARTGSNSVVVSGSKSTTGSALIASDPHLGLFVPNFWVLMGYHCPSYQVVGLMLPGVPAVTLGRNAEIAWGGTYMRAVSSHLFEARPDQITHTRKEEIKRRGWFSKSLEIKESIHGPVIDESVDPETKSARFLALNWVGHRPSNELGGFLSVNRAKNFAEFRRAFSQHGVAGLSMTFADKAGNIGIVPAVGQPLLKKPEYDKFVKSSDNRIERVRFADELPFGFNPPQGFIASTNNLPVTSDPPLAYPFSETDRINRLTTLLRAKTKISLVNLKEIQRDVYSESALRLNSRYIEILSEVPKELTDYYALLKGWDGHYTSESSGALAFETLSFGLAERLFESEPERLRSSEWRESLEHRLSKLELKTARSELISAMFATRRELSLFSNWGEKHVHVVQTPLGLVPGIGARFRHGEFSAPGSVSTIYKASFQPGYGERRVTFGAQSRHVSDLSHVDENYFVLFGGNDGWLNNPNLTGQVEKWRRGELIRVPLSPEGVSQAFPHSVILSARAARDPG